MKQVGRELGLRYALEGSVRRAGDRVRLTAQLVEAEAESRAIEACLVTVGFDTDRRRVTALEGVSFAVERNGFMSVIGPSGCGKSTLLRAVAGLIEPASGTLSVFGASPREARLQRSFGFVFQDAALMPRRTVRQNIELPLEIGGHC